MLINEYLLNNQELKVKKGIMGIKLHVDNANRMKSLILTIGVILIASNSFAQLDNLKIYFEPSFMENCEISIQKSSDNYILCLKESNTLEKVNLNQAEITPLIKFFEFYDFKHSGSKDTIRTKTVDVNGDTLISERLIIGMDGITVEGKLEFNSKTKGFTFWSPKKGSENHKLIELLFDLMNENFQKDSTIKVLEDLEQYFRFGLGLKKISDTPLKYKLYGSISSNEAEELYHFFKSIPTEMNVYIDLSNFQGMGTMFDDDFFELKESKRNVKFINCSLEAIKMFERIEKKQ